MYANLRAKSAAPQLYKMLAPAEAVKLSIREVRSKVRVPLGDNLLTLTLGLSAGIEFYILLDGLLSPMSNERTQLSPRVQEAGQLATGVAQLLAAGRGWGRQLRHRDSDDALDLRGSSLGPGAGAWALITEVLGLQGDAAKAALTLEQRQKVMKKVPPPVCSTGLQRVK